ncbi:translocation and assembly module lipoprotein TamL [Chitinophagaceae bacterium MMS25-I14]
MQQSIKENACKIVLLAIICLLASCSATKHLPKNTYLYDGAAVSIKDKQVSKKERKELKTTLAASVRPAPNRKILSMRVRLSAYYAGGGDSGKHKGLKKLFYNYGEPPVLFSSFNTGHNIRVLENMLQNRGFFQGKVSVTTDTGKRTIKARFEVTTGPQYTYRKVEFVKDSTIISKDIAAQQDKTFLKPGQPYSLDQIKGERARIDKILKDKGYYYFKPDYILTEADTNVGDNKVDMFVRIKQAEVPDKARNIYYIHDVYIYPNFKLNAKNADTNKSNATFYDGYYVFQKEHAFKPSVFSVAMQFDPGDTYSRRDQDASLNRLVSLGTFKFVKNSFREVDTSLPSLDAYYYLTPYPKKSIRFELGGNTQNDSRVGSRASFSWRNRNAFRGAELFQVKLSGGFEVQYTGENRVPNTYQAGIENSVSIPRFVVPFFSVPSSSFFMPRTIISAGYTLETQAQALEVHSVKGAFTYSWKEDSRKQHQLTPLNLYFVRTDTVGTPVLSYNYTNLIFNGIIAGPSYEFTYNTQTGQDRVNNYYFDGLVEVAGGIKGIGHHADYNEGALKLYNADLAQYTKLQADFRYYHNFTPQTSWAGRIFFGAGLPFGYSYQLPNIKQYFSGGSSSLRGFQSRMVGPGTFNEQYLYGTNNYLELLGDLKLEMNAEYRKTLYKFLKGAVFADAGNIWLYTDNPNFPGGQFSSSFYKELAVDAGVGLRLDFKIVMLRLDLGMPVRKPWLPEGQRWVFNQIEFGDPDWRKNNLVLNVAIGYPF